MSNLLGAKSLYRIFRNRIRPRKESLNRWMTRQFQDSDFKSVPADWTIGPPDFVGIASAKSGTTWWYRLLLEHPDVKQNRLSSKELSYFPHFLYKDPDPAALETYKRAFAAPPGGICGEWSPGYLTLPFALENLASAAPNAKLIAMLRNPIDRVPSAFNQMLSVRLPNLELSSLAQHVVTVYSLFVEVIHHSMFSASFQRLLTHFPHSQLLVLQYEQCKRDPATEIARTYRFLGLDDAYVPASLHRKINVTPKVVSQLTSSERTRLADYFSQDVKSLTKLFPDLNLDLWPDFV